MRRLSDAVAKTGVLFKDLEGLEMAGVRHTRLHQEPRSLGQYRCERRRDAAFADVPFADIDSYALRQCEMVVRNLASQPALAQFKRRGNSRCENGRPSESPNGDRLFHRQSVGDGRDQTRRRRLFAPSRPLASARRFRRRALVDRAGRSQASWRRQMDDAAYSRHQAVRE